MSCMRNMILMNNIPHMVDKYGLIGIGMRLSKVSKMSWEFHSTRKLLLQSSVSPTGLGLCFLHDEDYK